MSASAEYKSLIAHSDYFRRSRETGLSLTDFEKSYILQVCEESYSAARYALPSDWMTRAHFDRVCLNLDRTSTPGFPYCQEKPTIGEWLGWNDFEYDLERLDRLWDDMNAFLEGHLTSLYRVFVKQEPHKVSKKLQNRWRIIICPPLFEQVAWTMVFGTGNDKEIETVGLTPSMQGMKLSNGHWKQHFALFEQEGLTEGLDKCAWDWTAHKEWIDLDLMLRHRLITSPSSVKDKWKRLAQMLYDRAFINPKLVLSDGRVFQQKEPGIMKSGCVNTISSNSHMQIFLHIFVALLLGYAVLPLPAAVGDDTLSNKKNTAPVTAYSTTGAIIKPLEDGLQFVGHDWGPLGPIPSYKSKHMYRFLEIAERDLPSFLESMVRIYACDTDFQEFWRLLANQYNVQLPSEDYIKFWYDFDYVIDDAWNSI